MIEIENGTGRRTILQVHNINGQVQIWISRNVDRSGYKNWPVTEIHAPMTDEQLLIFIQELTEAYKAGQS